MTKSDHKMSCIVLEDEPIASEKIISYINKTQFLDLSASFSEPLSALQWLENNHADLAFTDIQMPEFSGIEWAKMSFGKTMVIFTTAYESYAIEGYKVNAIDYLLKPYSYSEFYNASQKAYKTYLQNAAIPQPDRSFFFIKTGFKTVKLDYDKIKYIKGAEDYCEFFIDQKKILSKITLKELIEQLPLSIFIRVHRSYIINLTKIEYIEQNVIVFGNERIPVSEKYISNLNNYLKNKK